MKQIEFLMNINSKIMNSYTKYLYQLSFQLYLEQKKPKRKLFRIIASEEYKFWKFLSQNKLLNQNRINLDVRLLENYYKNKGFYNVKVESIFAEFFDEGMFDLTFNINAGNK